METLKKNDVLVNRSQMVIIARGHNLFVSLSTIHRWANERSFPRPVGKGGKNLLYLREEYIKFLNRRLEHIQQEY